MRAAATSSNDEMHGSEVGEKGKREVVKGATEGSAMGVQLATDR